MTFITVTEPLEVRKHLVTFNTNCNSKVKRSIFYINVYYKKCVYRKYNNCIILLHGVVVVMIVW